VALEPEYNQTDGLHPNQRGVEQIVERLAPVVLRWLTSEQPGGAEPAR
jgi:lysophospholipase L1-like esterase